MKIDIIEKLNAEIGKTEDILKTAYEKNWIHWNTYIKGLKLAQSIIEED